MIEAKQNTSKMIEMINRKRHDWLNHLQVLLGYIALHKHEDMKGYLLGMVEELQGESRVAKLGDPEFILFLLSYTTRYPSLQFEIDLSEPVNLVKKGFTQQEFYWIKEWFKLFGEYLAEEQEDTPSLMITITEMDNLVHITTDFVGRLHDSACEEAWAAIKQNLNQLSATIEENVKTKSEWVVTYTRSMNKVIATI